MNARRWIGLLFTLFVIGILAGSPQIAQAGDCTIYSYDVSPSGQVALGAQLFIQSTSNCTTNRLVVRWNDGRPDWVFYELGTQNISATLDSNQIGDARVQICVQGHSGSGWNDPTAACEYADIMGGQGQPVGSQPGANVRCWIDQGVAISPGRVQQGQTVSISATGQCDGNVRAVQVLVDGNVIHEFGGSALNAQWNTSNASIGYHRAVFLITAGEWSQAARSEALFEVVAPGGATPVPEVIQGPPANNGQPGQTGQSGSGGVYNPTGVPGSGGSGSSCDNPSGLETGAIARVVYDDIGVRSQPSGSSSTVATLSYGHLVTIIGGGQCIGREHWLPIGFEGQQGWLWAHTMRPNSGGGSGGSSNSGNSGGSSSGSSGSSGNASSGNSGNSGSSNSSSSDFGGSNNSGWNCGGPNVNLTVGGQGQVTPGLPNNVRSSPGSFNTEVGEIPAGGVFDVIGGPACAQGIQWWQVRYGGITGWTGAADNNSLWIQPYNTASVPSPTEVPQTGGGSSSSDPISRSQPEVARFSGGSIPVLLGRTDRVIQANLTYELLVTYDHSSMGYRIRTVTVQYIVDPFASADILCWSTANMALHDQNGTVIHEGRSFGRWFLFNRNDEEESLDVIPYLEVGAYATISLAFNFNCFAGVPGEVVDEAARGFDPPEGTAPAIHYITHLVPPR